MPIYEYVCEKGHHSQELVGVVADACVTAFCSCGAERYRVVSMPARNAFVPPHMTNEGYDARAKNKALFIDTPETQAKLKSGEYDVCPSDDGNSPVIDDPTALTPEEKVAVEKYDHKVEQMYQKVGTPEQGWTVPYAEKTIEVPDE